MKKEDFIALGISEEQAEKAAAASAEELKGYIPKNRFDEVNQERKQLKSAKESAEAELEKLKQNAGDNIDLQKQIQQLQEAAAQKDSEHAQELNALKLTNAIRLGVTDAQDADIVAGLLDREKLVLGEDGKVSGLEEQLKTLRTEKPFLFKKAEDKGSIPFRVGSIREDNSGGVGTDGGKQMSMREAIAAKLSSQKTES